MRYYGGRKRQINCLSDGMIIWRLSQSLLLHENANALSTKDSWDLFDIVGTRLTNYDC
jgi:hypothetical protein